MLKQKLRELRTKKKLTQKELSEKLGLSKNAVCEYEKGRAEPSIETLIKLSRIFEVSLDYLVGRDEDFDTDLFTQKRTIFKLFDCLSADCRKTIIDTMRLMACPDKSAKPDKVKNTKQGEE